MTIEIHKYTKDGLQEVASIEVLLSNSSGMTISHYADSTKSTGVTIPFVIESTERHTPYIGDVEFVVSVRKKVNMVAVGPNEKAIKDVGQDVGKYDYVDSVPTRPSDLPPGFEELYKE